MPDREKVIKGLEYCEEYFNCCDKCPYWDGGTHCTADLAHDALALLKEQEEERRNIVHWLGKFCAYLDFKDECWSYEQNLEFFRKKMKEQFGWDVTDDA